MQPFAALLHPDDGLHQSWHQKQKIKLMGGITDQHSAWEGTPVWGLLRLCYGQRLADEAHLALPPFVSEASIRCASGRL